MHSNADQINLDCLHRAQQGDEESRSLLAQQAKGRMYTFIYRMCLDHDLSEDLTQETLMALIRALARLQLTNESAFWSWLYRTALGKVQHHFRHAGARRIDQRTTVNSKILETMSDKAHTGPATTLWRKEMVEHILDAMGALTLEYRTVLTLRCLEDQSYAEIAVVLGGSQMRAKMLFYRAKASLMRQLARKGLSRSHFLSALTVFGAMTCTSTRSASAMTSVTAASAEVTVSGAVLGTLLSKAGLISLGILLAMTGAGFLVPMVSTRLIPSMWKKPAIPAWPGPGQPQFNATMYFMGTHFSLTDIAASHNPDQDDWRYFENGQQTQDIRGIAALKDRPSNATLVLEQDHWIEYGFLPARLLNRPGPEIGLFVLNEGILPSVYLTDGAQRLQQISVTHYRAGNVPGLLVLGFDLSAMALDFEARRIRIVGHDRAGRFGGCAIIKLAVSLAARQ